MRWICTQENQYWKEMTIPQTTQGGETLAARQKNQEIWGFGGCFNELGYTSLSSLSAEKRGEIMKELFSPDACNFRFCRLPMGANDFSLDWYSFDETAGDFELRDFSIQRDEKYIIPFIREAQTYQKDLELFASPWSPPTWMKTPAVYNFGRLNSDAQTLDAYARYFVRFVQEYQAHGIGINRVCPQNEVFANQKFPSCLYTGELMRDFVRDHLGPLMEKGCPDTEIWLGTINGPYDDYLDGDWLRQNYNAFTSIILKDAEARKYLHGAALQWGGKHMLDQLRLSYPDFDFFQSECECGNGKNSYDSILYLYEQMWRYFQAGARAFVYWNLSLNQTAGSTWGWFQNSLVTVDEKTGESHYNPEFYMMKHFSAFVPKGSRHVSTEGGWTANALCFARPDGKYVFIIVNPFTTEETLTLSAEHQNTQITMPPRSLSTIILD